MKLQCCLGIMFLGIFLQGCGSQIDTVNQEMAQIRSQPPLPIEAAPHFESVPHFEYAAQHLRSPFLPNSMASELMHMSTQQVKPNFSRETQYLEDFELESLQMKGSMKNDKGQRLAVIQTADAQVATVKVGQYMGFNQGRIINITEAHIDLLEVVSDGRNGYVERPRRLLLVQANSQ
ncbi:type IV pilus assembly protein PilP [Acinetobacter calcoaceticus]|uniref:Type IV pilus assembly protein PilP n=1 Tax=Acinetobacter calcoaceticus TaxID=471 RepID=A0A4R1Y0L8_ACICA|nr:type IV pilus assembly protein PilP [Acinetobacter calcoaceticus]